MIVDDSSAINSTTKNIKYSAPCILLYNNMRTSICKVCMNCMNYDRRLH